MKSLQKINFIRQSLLENKAVPLRKDIYIKKDNSTREFSHFATPKNRHLIEVWQITEELTTKAGFPEYRIQIVSIFQRDVDPQGNLKKSGKKWNPAQLQTSDYWQKLSGRQLSDGTIEYEINRPVSKIVREDSPELMFGERYFSAPPLP